LLWTNFWDSSAKTKKATEDIYAFFFKRIAMEKIEGSDIP